MFQACNAHGLYCVPLYDTLGVYHLSTPLIVFLVTIIFMYV